MVVGMTGHAPVASTLLLPEPSSFPPAGTCLPGTVVSLGWSLVPQLPVTELPALPGNCSAFYSPSTPSFCFPYLEGNGSEAQVSTVEEQLLPLQTAPVLLCFLIP